MQDNYVGDIGDLAKLGLLRALGEGRQLGVAWYLYPHEEGTDGQHLEYLDHHHIWQMVNEDVFNGLAGIIDQWRNNQGERLVMDPAYLGLLPGAVFADERLCHHPRNNNEPTREQWRHDWFERVLVQLQCCDTVFADPDNGLRENNRFYYDGRSGNWKRLPVIEALQLAKKGRTTVIYHHNGRPPGGVHANIEHWMGQLPGCNHAFLCRRFGNRTFFVLNAEYATVNRLTEFVEQWRAVEAMAGIPVNLLSYLIP